MKTVCLYILTFFWLINPKIAHSSSESYIHPLEGLDSEIDQIVIKKKFPLKEVNANLIMYLELVKIYKRFIDYDIELSQHLVTKIQNKKTFSGDDLYLIKRTFDMFFKLNTKMIEFGQTYKFKASTMAKSFAIPGQKTPMIKAHFIWLTSNLYVIHHIQEVHRLLYKEDDGLRRIVKNIIGDKEVDILGEAKLQDLTLQLNTVVEEVESMTFIQQIVLLHNIYKDLEKIFAGDEKALFLLSEAKSNIISQEINQGKRKFNLNAYTVSDSVVGFFNKVSNFLSGFFGNLAGNVKWRKGYLYENPEALKLAKTKLKPLDILLEKSPFVLTDKFIPGHFGHAALYLGTKEELESIEMWNHPDIAPYHEAIINGKIILEAVRPGVRLTSLEDFMNIDEVTIIRKKDALDSAQNVSEQITRGLEQIGKSYDFNFDISTLDKIVCSELIYIVYGAVSWPTQYRVGRPTVTPDDISEILFYKGSPFSVETGLLSANKRQKLETTDIHYLASKFDYELRTSTGEEIKDPNDSNDPTNSFWKKETKCYNVAVRKTVGDSRPDEIRPSSVRQCKTTYKEFYYEENTLASHH